MYFVICILCIYNFLIVGNLPNLIMTKSSDNKTEISEATAGVLHTGSGDVNIFGANLMEAIRIIRQLVPEKDNRALDNIIQALEQLRIQQKRINEWKRVHNMLHDLELALSILELVPNGPEPNIVLASKTWRISVRPRIKDLSYFAANEMGLLPFPRLELMEGGIKGPPWITHLIVDSSVFESSLKENDWASVGELCSSMLDKCRESLFFIDRQLLDSIGILDKYSDQILKVINNE